MNILSTLGAPPSKLQWFHQKAFDMVNWGNLFIILKLLGFPPGSIILTEMIVTTDKSALLVNGKAKPWFKPSAVEKNILTDR